MREIKFRAFDAVLGMYDVNVMAGNGTWWQVLVDGKIYTLSESELMQYTGLRDQNGVEIYEGDIVRVPYNHIGNQVVKFHNGQFNIVVFDVAKLWVIGNIYENSELLNDTP